MKSLARWWKEEKGKVRCLLCPVACVLSEGSVGSCGVRVNEGGRLYTYTYGSLISAAVDPVEKKPLFHFLPGHRTLTIATPGCNLHCKGCQNWEISQIDKGEVFENPFYRETFLPPEVVVEKAVENGCRSISYSYSDPTIFAEYMIEVAKLAKERGLRNIMVSAGYLSLAALEEIDEVIDAYSIDLKFFSDRSYKLYSKGRLEPVLKTIKFVFSRGKWIELTTLLVPQYLTREQLRSMADWIVKELGDYVPWHLSRFFPHYRAYDLPSTSQEDMEDAFLIAKEAGLKYVYLGNLVGNEHESTYCPRCDRAVILREGYRILAIKIDEGKCKFCGYPIEGVWK